MVSLTTYITFLIVPAECDIQGQLRIQCREHHALPAPGLSNYRDHPELWREAGLITASSGRIVCLQASQHVHNDMKDCEPLRPPLTFTYNLKDA